MSLDCFLSRKCAVYSHQTWEKSQITSEKIKLRKNITTSFNFDYILGSSFRIIAYRKITEKFLYQYFVSSWWCFNRSRMYETRKVKVNHEWPAHFKAHENNPSPNRRMMMLMFMSSNNNMACNNVTHTINTQWSFVFLKLLGDKDLWIRLRKPVTLNECVSSLGGPIADLFNKFIANTKITDLLRKGRIRPPPFEGTRCFHFSKSICILNSYTSWVMHWLRW